MNRKGLSLALCASAAMIPGAAFAKCELKQLSDLPVSMSGPRAEIVARLNGQEARFTVDSGAFWSMVSSSTAAAYGLKMSATTFGLLTRGIDADVNARQARAAEFSFAGNHLKNIDFLVTASGIPATSKGVLGQNVLGHFDVEYDLGKGEMRLFRTEGCDNKSKLAYWAQPDQYSVLHLSPADPDHPLTQGEILVNGKSMRVELDSGAWTSLITVKGAARAGIKPGGQGVTDHGYLSGVGQPRLKQYVATVAEMKLGDNEYIQNTKIRMVDVELPGETDIILGADFLATHRLLVANTEQRIYFTYSGGRVFNLDPAESGSASSATPPSTHSRDEPPGAQLVRLEPLTP